MGFFSVNNNDEILVNAIDQPIECELCPCGLVPCCVAGHLTPTVTANYTINGTITRAATLNKVGNGYTTPSPTVLCDFGDGHNIIYLDIVLTCSATTWNFVFAYSHYVDGFLQNYVQWSFSYTVGVDYVGVPPGTTFYAQCVPFLVLFQNTNTSGAAPLGSPLNCSGTNFPFTASAGVIVLQLSLS